MGGPPPPNGHSFAVRMEQCPLLVLSRVPLAWNAIPSFLRVLDWLTIYQPMGVLEVIQALEPVLSFPSFL